ncbi:MAG: response regulator, partial [Lachnospiraceae bacterium]|nr:response regulator [Lachnospiraceae bacterium]
MEPIKVFITEDESIVREGLRDMIPWEQYGFVFAGEASDGETALPMVRRIRPDILITDIKMPFMDGLEFSRLVSRELPATKIIILSGYDDFEYARQAIELHVDQYLLKPITKAAMVQALEQTRSRIEEEHRQQEYLQQFIRESREYEHYERRDFFEKLVGGTLTVPQIYEQAAELEIDLDAECFNIVLFSLQGRENDRVYSEESTELLETLIENLYRNPDFLVFREGILSYAVLVKAEKEQIGERTARCLDIIRTQCENTAAVQPDWYAAVGTPVPRLSEIPRCYMDAGHAMAFRHIMPGEHVLTAERIRTVTAEQESYHTIDAGTADPMLIRGFIRQGTAAELDDFVSEYFDAVGNAADSLMFRNYLLLSARVNALAAIEELGISRSLLMDRLPMPGQDAGADLKSYLTEVLHAAVSLRDEETQRQGGKLLENALEYIDGHYTDEDMSLNTLARAINVSTNYLSAIFSQKMGISFVEYLTQKRMTRAKQLLK